MNCPQHHCELMPIPHPSGKGWALACPVLGCDALLQREKDDPSALKLPGMERGKESVRLKWREEDTARTVDQGARALGWTNLSTVHQYKFFQVTCPACDHAFKTRPSGTGYGATPGIPDRLIAPPWLPPYLWIGVELKGSETPFTNDDQERLAACRRIAVCRDWDQVQATVEYVKAMKRSL